MAKPSALALLEQDVGTDEEWAFAYMPEDLTQRRLVRGKFTVEYGETRQRRGPTGQVFLVGSFRCLGVDSNGRRVTLDLVTSSLGHLQVRNIRVT